MREAINLKFQSSTGWKLEDAKYFMTFSFLPAPQVSDCSLGNNWGYNLNLGEFSEALKSTRNYAEIKNLIKF